MAQRKIQLLRSQTIYADIDAARTSIDNNFAETAGLSDGELVLARYYATETSIGGGTETVVRSLLGIYNSKDSSHPGFTYITNEQEIASVTDSIYDRLNNIEQSIDALDLNEPIGGSTGTAVTEINQQNGQVSGTATAVEDLTLDGYTKTNDTGDIDAGDSLEVAFSKLENAIDTIDVDIHSTDETITVTSDATGKNLEVNIDGQSIVQDPTTKKLKTNLQISKITTGLGANVKEAYQLQDSSGNTYGQQINIYKDSTLKDVYLGTQWDSVDSTDGTVKHVQYIAKDSMIFIDSEIYQSISETDRSLYDASSRNVYTIKKETITPQEYYELDSDQSLLYEYNTTTELFNIRIGFSTIFDDKYSQMTESQKELYTQSVQNGYRIKEDKKYLSSEEYDAIFDGQQTSVYESLETIQQQTGKSDLWQSLNFVYALEDGTYQMVKVDVSKFLSETEFGQGFKVSETGIVSVFLGEGLHYKPSIGVSDNRIHVYIDPTSDEALTVGQNGLKLDLTSITDNQLNSVTSGNNGITVSEKANNSQSISLQLSETVKTNTADAQYAGETVEEEVDGEIIVTEVHNNILQIKNDGLYLDSTWDCGEY